MHNLHSNISVLVFRRFFLYGKKLSYVVTHDVCPSSVEISLERGCNINNRPIDPKFGLNIRGRVMHV